ncbi:MAG: hypothetical protein GQ547_00670, partial [Methylophaga sp.]|nr:hypothetical protein [Methylophaga sp.]
LNNASLTLPMDAKKSSSTVDSKKESKFQGVVVRNNTELKTQQAVEDVKSSVIIDESNEELKGLSTDKKQQGPTLRSDILNPLTKKTGDVGNKVHLDGDAVKTEKTITAQLLEKPLNDVRKMAELMNQQKPESPSPTPVSERAFSGLNTALSSGMGSALSSATVQGTAISQPVLALQPSMQSEAWGRVLSSRVVWMAREGVQQVELRLNPANLGPVDVKLHMNNDQANVTFVAQNAATRDALEQALPRLRESFQENGMNLANADVSEQASEQEGEESTDSSSQAANGNINNEGLETENPHELIESDELELGRLSIFA